MKIVKKAITLALAAGFLAASTGCADTSWSYKSDKTTLAIGTYIYYMSGAYGSAKNDVESATKEPTTNDKGETQATEAVNVMTEKIKDKDDNNKEIVVRDYITKTAEKNCKRLIFILEKFNQLGLKLTSEQQAQIDAMTSQSWAYSNKLFGKLGVAKESYKITNEFNVKREAIFNAMYNKGGEKAVSDDELKQYYTSTYVDYSYIPINLYKTKQSDNKTSDSANSSTTTSGDNNDALSDGEIKKIKDTMNGYKDSLNQGKKDFSEIDKEFMKYQKLEESTAKTAQETLDDSTAPKDIIEAVKKLGNNKAEVIEVGENKSSKVMYLVYRGDINKKVDDLKNDSTRSTVLTKMKDDEFTKYIDEQANKLNIQKNDAALNKYTPEETEKKIKEFEAEVKAEQAKQKNTANQANPVTPVDDYDDD